jgi:uncharacterized membrane protein
MLRPMRSKPIAWKNPMRTLTRNFINGSLVLVPVVATFYVVYFVLAKLDALLGIGIPGLGLLLAIALITTIGALTSNVIGKELIELADVALSRVPFVKLIYTSFRDLMLALFGSQKRFDRPVLVALGDDPVSAVKILGFITREDLAPWGPADHVAVYFPQSINFAGQLLLVPNSRVQRVEIEPSQLFPFLVSGGITGAAAVTETEAAAHAVQWPFGSRKP